MRQKDEEILNAITHLVSGIVCFIIMIIVTTHDSFLLVDRIAFLPMIGTTAWTFFSSFIYHASEKHYIKERNRQLDKSAIFLMILGSGTTTIFTCHNKILAITTSIALCVILFLLLAKFCTSREFPDWLSVSAYIIVGWVSTFPSLGIFDASDYTQFGVVPWILLSGGFYCIGVIFYARDSIKWFHTIWHVFVMAGAGIHLATHIYVMHAKSIAI